ncbi:phosphoglycerate dehydrogenase-like enzyme [Antricoccus suffuscus]|uniref:Phosphoglycerate dehydrogenase-like enzyme n=2 Tax=Antricoccus suffuscus TaxID=1629062 RepID=A0A2T0ZVS7_9ACTN|nr:phosphoglycerate dehydrogenase-like enzyme [Antricoccus suffuscus]
MLRCVVLDDYQTVATGYPEWAAYADALSVDALSDHISDTDELVARIGEYDVVVAMRERTEINRSLLERLPRLKLIVTTGMRNASIDVTAAAELGITVCGTESATAPTVELTWALILGLARRIVAENNALRSGGPWQSTLGVDLHGRTLGVIGLGRLGSRVARVGTAFGMQTVAWSQNLTADAAAASGARLASSLDELLAVSDVATIHLKLSDRTRGLLGAQQLGAMKPSALLVNTSRAPIIDQAALRDTLAHERLGGVALDVFDVEPLPADDYLRTAPRLLATPHLGYVTEENYGTYFFPQAVEDIAAFAAGKAIRVIG